jgi:catechol 2,3-dioxygenase-like lactoylglutathione lyase family enzyme
VTDQPTDPEPARTGTSGGGAGASAAAPAAATPPPQPTFEQRMNRFGHEVGEAGERWGKRAEAAGERWAKDPALMRAGDTVGRVWGLILLAVGLWFFADITLGYDMPSIAWRDLWPIGLIGIGFLVLARGITRRA